MCERTIAEYEEKRSSTKEENEGHQLLDAVFKKHQDVQQAPHFKEEKKELWITQEGKYLLGQEEADLTRFPLTVVSVKTEDHEEKPPESSQLHHSPNVCEGHLLPERQGWTSRMEQETSHPPNIKNEEEEHFERLEVFPLTVVIVKSEYDEVISESEEKREAEPPSSSSIQHMTTEGDGDHCGGSQADKLLAPLSDSDETTSHSPGTDDEDCKTDQTCHTDNTHFQCSHCDKTFKHRHNLTRHTRIHTGEKQFFCSVCGKCFLQNGDLKVHMRIHTGDKPYSCSSCGKDFTQRQHLKTHMKIHTGEKRFSCSICGKCFIENCVLKRHMRIHTGEKPFVCLVCGKRFSQKHSLKMHAATHTGEKPFSCSVCAKGFMVNIDLKIHMRIHTGEKPFSCSICGKSFTQRQHLKRHMRRHTSEKLLSYSVCDEGLSYTCAGENCSSK
ncbi:zinc finger protein 135-like isoform X11 [Entelurus aequoreus]|uniref:zinc finger protein 135-like isoform X11 n=1 Tax=Entelurus aequoreus TaxID=161455 RepID=UPI002B1E0C80|nr:zinc finger protein 135-like isoform X11 [Entelurus aequoreus]